MFTKLPLITETKITVVKNICKKNFQTCKKDVMFLLIFKKLQKKFQFFEQVVKSVSIFFDIMQKMFQLF